MLASLGHEVMLLCQTGPDVPDNERVGKASLRRRSFTDVAPLHSVRAVSWRLKLWMRWLDFLRSSCLRLKMPRSARIFALAEEFVGVAAEGERFVLDEWQGEVDVVHAVGLPALPAAVALARRFGARAVYDSIELERDRNAAYSWSFNYLRLRIERYWIVEADAVVTVSTEIARQLTRDYRIRTPAVIANVAGEQESRDSVRSALGLARTTPLVAYAGLGLGDRGLLPATDALKRLPDWRLGIVGVSSDAAARRAPNLGDAVAFVPPRPPGETAAFLRDADVAVAALEPVCASYAFALPNKLYQYVAAGLPLVVGRTPALRRVVEGSGLGEAVDEREAPAFAAAIARQASRKGSAEYLAARARFLLANDMRSATAAWVRVYGEIGQKPPRV